MTRSIDEIKANITAKASQPEIIREPVLVTLSDVQPQKLECHWDPYLVRGRLNVAMGDAGIGKSFLTHVLIAANSIGAALPGEEGYGTGQPVRPPRSSILLTAEDGLPEIVAPRLIDMGADLTKIHALTGVAVTNTETGKKHEVSLTLEDLGPLEAAINRYGDVSLAVIDPLQSYVGTGVEMRKSNEFRPLLDGAGKLAEKYGITVLVITHMNRNTGANSAYRVSNAQEIYNYARSVLVVALDPANKQRRIIAHQKHNGTPEGVSLAFEIRGDGRFYWDGTSDLNADQLLAAPRSDEERGALDDAATWLSDELTAGPMPVRDLKKAATDAGMSWRTIERAKTDLGVTAKRQSQGNNGDGLWIWELPAKLNNPLSTTVGGLAVLPTMPMDTALSQDRQPSPLAVLPDMRPGRQEPQVSQDRQALTHRDEAASGDGVRHVEVSDDSDLSRRAVALQEILSRESLEQIRQRFNDCWPRVSAPPWWRDTATTEPLAVTIALELLATDGTLASQPVAYLVAARAAVAESAQRQ